MPPAAGDIVRLIAGDTLENVLDLSRYYALDEPGRYTIRFVPMPVPVVSMAGELPFAPLDAGDGELVVERY